MTDLTLLSAREAARRIAEGTLTAEALVRACLERIEAREATVRAWAFLDPDHALAQARARDRSRASGPLHGVPVGVKDVFDTADMPTAYGSPIYEGHRPAADAACVALLREAGAVVPGKTVTTEFAAFTPGPTRNPHHSGHTPGGSSSGSAAAVADRMVPLALGTQTAGSVIRPASFCGCVGYKPTYGWIPRTGVKLLAETLDTVGVFARDVPDAALLAAVLTGRPALRLPEEAQPPRPRIAVCRTPEWAHAQPGTQAAIEAAAEALRRAGAAVGEVEPLPEQDGLVDAQADIMAYEMARALAYERTQHEARLSPRLRELLQRGLAIAPETYDRALAHAARARAALHRLFGDYDALLVPAAPGEAPAGLEATGDPVFNRAWTLLHVPCLTVSAWWSPAGLPVGVQLVGRVGDDARLLAAARFLEQALEATTRP